MNKLYGAYCRTYQAAFRVATKVLDWTGPQVVKGPGSVTKLPSLLKSQGINNVMIVTDKVLHSLGLLDSLKAGLESKGINFVIYDGTQPNPTIPNVEEAKDIYINHNCQAVIAFGGGSPMDCAKVAAARVAAPGKQIPKMRGTLKVLAKLPPLYAIPTTAGTGSETTLAAVIVNPDTHEKFAINDPCLRPKV
ncbi:MAG: iron-containing alcohol dehydrogenase, partial [Clostridia bacterium]|nr:iron-containing alcohol dehydrogenase [Clostridia bacterium]